MSEGTIYHLGPGAFPEVSQARVSELLNNQLL